MSRNSLAALILTLALPAVAASPGLPDKLAGVYKHRFANADVQGDHYTSEDVLEIVPVSGDTAYVRLHLDFYNGHICDISGVARQAGESLVYDGPADTDGKPCRLTLASRGDGVHIFEDENGSCRNQTCGARGGYGYKADNPPDFTPPSAEPSATCRAFWPRRSTRRRWRNTRRGRGSGRTLPTDQRAARQTLLPLREIRLAYHHVFVDENQHKIDRAGAV